MRDCANCFHRKPVLKEDGTWTAECEKWDCEFQSRENMIEKTKAMNNDLISRSALKEDMKSRLSACNEWIEKAKDKETKIRASAVKAFIAEVVMTIDNAPTVETFTKDDIAGAYNEGYMCGSRESEKPKGEWINTSPYDDKGECSLCCYLSKKYYKFCPNCGVQMKGD